VHDAIAKGMGRDWSFKQILEPTIQDHLQNSVTIIDVQKEYNLSDDECGAIVYYTCDIRKFGGTREDCPYHKLNLIMAKREFAQLEEWKPYLYLFLSGLQKIPNINQKVYRALDQPISKLSKQYQQGKNVVWISFTSTSKDRSAVVNFIDKNNSKGTFMQINVIEGKDISPFSLFPSEQEVLLHPNSTFEVNEIISSEMKALMEFPLSIDGIILSQKPTLPHLLLMKSPNLRETKREIWKR